MPITPTAKIWMDGELVDWDQATVHVLTHSLHYGTGAFEGIRAYKTKAGSAIFRLHDHIARLRRSAALVGIDVPYSQDELCDAVKQTMRACSIEECYIRPIVFLGYGEMGVNPLPAPIRVSIAVWPWGAYLGDDGVKNGIRVKVSSWARHDPRSLPTAAKATGMYINSSLAKVEAIRGGYDEALMLTTDGFVSEGTGENIFLVRNGVLTTPPTSAVAALEGITRESVIAMANDLGYEVRESLIRRSDLYIADEAFFTGTAAEVVPIAEIDDRKVGPGRPGEVTLAIQQLFASIVRGEVDRYKDWLEYVE